MPRIAQHIAAALIGFAVVASIGAAPAYADPNDGSTGTGSPAAADNRPGTGSPSADSNRPGTGSPTFDKPVSIPDAPANPGPGATQKQRDDYDSAVAARSLAIAQERARVEAQKARAAAQQSSKGDDYCTLHQHDEACPDPK